MSLRAIIVGGHGKVALRLGRLLAGAGHSVVSLIRDESHGPDILETGAKYQKLSLEETSPLEISKVFQGADVVYFAAGAGSKGGPERTKTVDYEGAVKVFDAIEQVEGKTPRLITISGADVRDENKIPAHYNEEDKEASRKIRAIIPDWYQWKYEADKNLISRTKFKWFILRPGGLTDLPGTEKASIGVTHMTSYISRDDVAQTLFLLADREDAHGLAFDLVGGDTPIPEALNAAISKRETAFDASS